MLGPHAIVTLASTLAGIALALRTQVSFQDLEDLPAGGVSILLSSLEAHRENLEAIDRFRRMGRLQLKQLWASSCRWWAPEMFQEVRRFVQGSVDRELFFLSRDCINCLDRHDFFDAQARDGLIGALPSPSRDIRTILGDLSRLEELDPSGSWHTDYPTITDAQLVAHPSEDLLDSSLFRLELLTLWHNRRLSTYRGAIVNSFGRYAERSVADRGKLAYGLYGLYHVLEFGEVECPVHAKWNSVIEDYLLKITKVAEEIHDEDEMLLVILAFLLEDIPLPLNLHTMLGEDEPKYLCFLVHSIALHFYPEEAREDARDAIVRLALTWSDSDVLELLQHITILHGVDECRQFLQPAVRARLLAMPGSWPFLRLIPEDAIAYFRRWEAAFPRHGPSPLSTAETIEDLVSILSAVDLTEMQPRTLLGGRATRDVLHELVAFFKTQDTLLEFRDGWLVLPNSACTELQTLDLALLNTVLFLKLFYDPVAEVHSQLLWHLELGHGWSQRGLSYAYPPEIEFLGGR